MKGIVEIIKDLKIGRYAPSCVDHTNSSAIVADNENKQLVILETSAPPKIMKIELGIILSVTSIRGSERKWLLTTKGLGLIIPVI